MTNLEEAEAVRDGLRGKLDEARAALVELDAERQSLAFDAHTCGGEAEKKLAALNKRRLVLLGDIETLEHAHIEASRRVADGERLAELAEDAAKAGRAMEIAAKLLNLAQRVDAALAEVVKHSKAIDGLIGELNWQCKCPAPNHAQLESLGTRALKSAFMSSRFKIEHLAP